MFLGKYCWVDDKYLWITQKEKLVRFSLFIVDAMLG
jgi:hypothetical protein